MTSVIFCVANSIEMIYLNFLLEVQVYIALIYIVFMDISFIDKNRLSIKDHIELQCMYQSR